eukprot:12893517-Prorocentrum_lima.AAC.1
MWNVPCCHMQCASPRTRFLRNACMWNVLSFHMPPVWSCRPRSGFSPCSPGRCSPGAAPALPATS